MTVLAEILLALCWKALAVGAVAWLAASLPPLRRNPAARHAVWLAASLALLTLPLLETAKRATPPAALPRVEITAPAVLATAPTPEAAAPQIASPLPALFAALYLAGLALAAGRLAYGWNASRTFLQRARPTDHPALAPIAARCGLAPAPPLRTSPRFSGPVTAGVLRPAIVLPSGHERWTHARLEAVLAHECAHIARHDTRAALLIAVTRALYWFHPVAWRLHHHTARLMEQACDDFALRVLGDSRAYANALLATASPTANPNHIGALAMASHLSSRIDRVLSGAPAGAGILRRRSLASFAAATLVAALGVAVLTPVLAQQSGVSLEGVVVDASGARVPGVSVILRDRDQGVTEATVSGADGAFALRGLAPSEQYELEVEAGGFARAEQHVELLQNANVEVQLEIGGVREAIVVEADAPAVAAAPTRAPQRIRVGGNVQKARMIHHVQPQYPEAARAEGVEGTVLLEAVISVSGQPVSLTEVNNLVDSRLVAAATDAVSQWRYHPTQLNGQPVEVATTITVGFRLRR